MKKSLIALTILFTLLASSCEPTGSFSSSNNDKDSTSSYIDTTSNPKPNTSTSTNSGSSSEDPEPDDGEIITPDELIIHFKNDSESYDGLAFWLWSDVKQPNKEFAFTGIDENGMYIQVSNLKELFGENHSKLGIIVKSKGSWSSQTQDSYIRYSKFKPTLELSGKYSLEVFATENSKNTLDIVASASEASKDKIKTAEFSDTKTIDVTTSGPIKEYKLYAFNNEYYNLDGVSQKKDTIKSTYLLKEGTFEESSSITSFRINLDTTIILNRNYVIEAYFYSAPTAVSSYIISYEKLYDTSVFNNLIYDGDDLGATVDSKNNTTTFKVWSPVSVKVTLNLYKYSMNSISAKDWYGFVFHAPTFDTPLEKYEMSVDSTGTWSVTVNSNLHGTYYTYTVNNFQGESEVVDPYAKSAGFNGERGMVVDWTSDDIKVDEFESLPKVWDKDPTYDIDSPMDLVVSEVHIRDLTMDKTWTSDEETRKLAGTYEGFYTKGTTYTKDKKTVKTGFDHLEEYGVNAIQLLPIFDQENGEKNSSFNWGYNPLNFNCLEGSYSSNASDGRIRIKEFKSLVAAYANNKNHARIIMDVVYNHVSNANSSNFNSLVPYYYFRMTSEGKFSNGSGCNNEFKTESKMGSKFIVDSFKFWASTYNIKGFRLDLMGLYDLDTLKTVKSELYKIDPDIVIYGEGWTGGTSTLDESKRATTSNVYSSLFEDTSNRNYGKIGGFNDEGRNAIRGGNDGGWGSNDSKPGYGFISQGSEHLSSETKGKIADMMRGIHTGKGANPEQTVNYASCHDNYTLFDQLNWTLSDDGGKTEPNIKVVAKASVAVNAMILMSNGISFINGGEEIFRTKIEDNEDITSYEENMYGKRITHNSYCSSDFTNSYKYDRKVDLLDYFNMYKELVSIRKNLVTLKYDANTKYDGSGDMNTWNTDNSSTGIGIYRKGKDGSAYVILINGRSDSYTMPCGSQTSLIFNNSSITPSFISDGGYTLDKYNLVIYKT